MQALDNATQSAIEMVPERCEDLIRLLTPLLGGNGLTSSLLENLSQMQQWNQSDKATSPDKLSGMILRGMRNRFKITEEYQPLYHALSEGLRLLGLDPAKCR